MERSNVEPATRGSSAQTEAAGPLPNRDKNLGFDLPSPYPPEADIRGFLAKVAKGRFCCKSPLRRACKRDSVVLTRIAARSIHDGPSEE
jgi:hypothetical protein